MEYKYLKPLRACSDILSEAKGVNYIIAATDAVEDDSECLTFAGGSGWNIEYDEGGPDFVTMVGGIFELYMSENKMSYKDKLNTIRRFYNELLEHITRDAEIENTKKDIERSEEE